MLVGRLVEGGNLCSDLLGHRHSEGMESRMGHQFRPSNIFFLYTSMLSIFSISLMNSNLQQMKSKKSVGP